MSDDDADDEIFATKSYEATSPLRREFHPWHRPRKQFVRREQWLEQVHRLLDGQAPDRPLRYLGLPGPDLLDVRLFHRELCASRQMRFLGFNTAAAGHGPTQVDLNISLEEVRSLANLDPLSHVVPDDFRTLARPDSMGWKSALDTGPFDIVNLDLCDNFFSDEMTDSSIYGAIAHLFGLQRKAMHPWLLLLTTRVDRSTVDVEVARILSESLDRNVHECADFEAGYRKLTGLGSGTDLPEFDSCPDEQWMNVAGVAIAKWLLAIAIAAEMSFEFKSCMSYRVSHGDGPDDLLSVAIQLSSTIAPVKDPAGLSVSASVLPDECKEAAKIPPRLQRLVSVDALLAGDADLVSKLISETSELLVSARYSLDEYLAWAAL